MMLTRRALLSGVAALLLAPVDLLEPRKKLWALGGLALPNMLLILDQRNQIIGRFYRDAQTGQHYVALVPVSLRGHQPYTIEASVLTQPVSFKTFVNMDVDKVTSKPGEVVLDRGVVLRGTCGVVRRGAARG